MNRDTKDTILKDWNASDVSRTFLNFKELFDYIEGMSKEMGKQSKKEIYNHPAMAKQRFTMAHVEIEKRAKRHSKAITIMVATFRRRIKLLSKSQRGLTQAYTL